MASIKLEFDGMDKMIERFEEMEKSIIPATEKALEKTVEVMTPGIQSAIAPHHKTGRTEESLIEVPIVGWEGNTATVRVGFKIREGGLASQFLIYGAKAGSNGTPARPPDMRLWSAIFGSSIQKKVAETQKKVFEEELLK